MRPGATGCAIQAAAKFVVQCNNSVSTETEVHQIICERMRMFFKRANDLPTADQALPGRDQPIPVPDKHTVLGTPLLPPFPELAT